jgi:hypothetical protein
MGKFKKIALLSVIFFASMDQRPKPSISYVVQNTPKCPPFVYSHDTGKLCARHFSHKFNNDLTLNFIEFSNDTYVLGLSYSF